MIYKYHIYIYIYVNIYYKYIVYIYKYIYIYIFSSYYFLVFIYKSDIHTHIQIFELSQLFMCLTALVFPINTLFTKELTHFDQKQTKFKKN